MLAFISAMTPVFGEGITALHSFAGGANDGSSPQCGMITVNGSSLYGATALGGTNDKGVLFKLDSNGGNFSVMHSFTGSYQGTNPDGMHPQGGLTLVGSKLYGMAIAGGTVGIGNLYSIDIDGANFNVLHSFTGGNDGGGPYDDLTAVGSILYGITYGGGVGSIFKINADGTGYSSKVPFSINNDHGPLGGLTVSGSKLYGMTYWSGIVEGGAIFQINTDFTGFNVIHTFKGGTNDGNWPRNSTLTLVNSTLYGVTWAGGVNDGGTLFKINLDGGDFQVLHSFGAGEYPNGDLTLVGSSLYGVAGAGGINRGGTIYKIDTISENFDVVYSFGAGNSGWRPVGGLTLSGSTLYGMTEYGGQYGKGTIYSFPVPEPSTFVMLGLGALGFLTLSLRRSRKAV
jgi:uncharacterized repeat protein (TIGR03803 family)